MIHGRRGHVGVRPGEAVSTRHLEQRLVDDRPGEAPCLVLAQGSNSGTIQEYVDVRAHGVEVTTDDGGTTGVALVDRAQ